VINIRSVTSFGVAVNPSVPCRKILRHDKIFCKVKVTVVGKIKAHFSQVSPALLLDLYSVYCQRALMGESEMIRALAGKYNRPVIVGVYGTPCTLPPCNSNSTHKPTHTYLWKCNNCIVHFFLRYHGDIAIYTALNRKGQ
jgi:hypothetical protein